MFFMSQNNFENGNRFSFTLVELVNNLSPLVRTLRVLKAFLFLGLRQTRGCSFFLIHEHGMTLTDFRGKG